MTDRGESLYRRCVVESHHHHLSCRLCGATVEVDAPELEKWAHDIGEAFGYRELRHVVEFNGSVRRANRTNPDTVDARGTQRLPH